MVNVKCNKCSAILSVKDKDILIRCPFCDVFLTYDKSAFIHSGILRRIISASMAGKIFKTRINFRKIGEISIQEDISLFYFPFWRITTEYNDKDDINCALASDPEFPVFFKVRLPDGELDDYNPSSSYDGRIVEVNIPIETALERMQNTAVQMSKVKEIALVYAPFYSLKLFSKSKEFTFILDASGGKLYEMPQQEESAKKRQLSKFIGYFVIGFIYLILGWIVKPVFLKLAIYSILLIPSYLALSLFYSENKNSV